MSRPRILLCPQFTEVEWAIAPQLSDWAEVATFDAPGVGDEEPAEGGMGEIVRGAVVDRALRELDNRDWDSYFVVGDAWGTATAVRVAAARPGHVLGIALGHASVDYSREGERPAVNGELVAAMTQLLRSDYNSFVRYGLTQFTQGGWDEDTARRMVERFPPMEIASRVWEMNVARPEPVGELLAELEVPMLFAKHEGCLVFTPEGFEDLASVHPDATTVSVEVACSASDEFAAALRAFCGETQGSD